MISRGAGRVVAKLSGGLGNQMFQYATAYSFARRNDSSIAVDPVSGFVRDRAYRRQYELGAFPIDAPNAGLVERLPFAFERLMQRAFRREPNLVTARPWGISIREKLLTFHREMREGRFPGRVWIDGFWQCERYFEDFSADIARQFRSAPPVGGEFISLGRQMTACNSVAVGVRLFEEAPGGAGHWAAPFDAYRAAAAMLEGSDHTYFVFCTRRSLVEGLLALPGPMVIVAADDGYHDTLSTFWLMQQCANFVISNSTFYWWAAWLAEQARPTAIVAIDNFPHSEAIPRRWLKVPREPRAAG